MKNWSEKKFKKIKIITVIFTVLLIILAVWQYLEIFGNIFGNGFIRSLSNAWVAFLFGFLPLVINILFIISWFFIVTISFYRFKNRFDSDFESAPSSRKTLVLAISGIIMILSGIRLLLWEIFLFALIIVYL